jgi:hypothetical protein
LSITDSPTGGTINFANPNIGPGGVAPTVSGLLGGQATAPVYAPGSFSSPYYLQQIQAQGGQVSVGADIGGILGIPPGSYQLHDLLTDFNRLSQSQLLQVQTLLWDGGFYTDTAGGPQSTPPTFGAHDNQSFMAFGNALMQSGQSGRSLDDTVMTNVSQGVGQAQRAGALQPQIGGGNAYTIDLTNPADIAYTARTVFQAALGRAPTQKELDSVVSTVQGGQQAAGMAKIGAQEGAEQRKFAATEAARQASNAPQVALGPVPNGPFADIGQWSVAFLRYLGDPVTTSNIAAVMGWAKAAGQGLAGNNPLGVNLAQAGSSALGGGPGPSPQKYQQPADGMKAAAQTLGNFPTLSAALKSEDASSLLGQKAIQDELRQFSGGAYSDISKQATGSTTAANRANQKWGDKTGAAQPQGAQAQGQPTLAERQAAIKGHSLDRDIPLPATAATAAGGGGGAGLVPADVMAAYGGNPPPNVTATWQAAHDNPAVAAYLQSVANQSQGLGTTVPPQTLGGQQPVAPGTTYLPSSVLSDVNAPAPEAAAFQAATTGANRTPYLGYQYLNAFQAIMDMVHAGGLLTGSGH